MQKYNLYKTKSRINISIYVMLYLFVYSVINFIKTHQVQWIQFFLSMKVFWQRWIHGN